MKLSSTHFPYCIKRTAPDRYILLNRNYKPLGIQTPDWIAYTTDPSVIGITITPATARKLSWEGRDDQDSIHLYSDGCMPTDSAAHMTAYLKRLDILMNLMRKAE